MKALKMSSAEPLSVRTDSISLNETKGVDAVAHYEGIKAFSETAQTDDLKAITVPTLLLHGDDDQVVPYQDASVLQARLFKKSTLKICPGYPHGMITTHPDVINADILAFIKGAAVKAA